jgi:CHASE3 domain sensor protein
LGTAYVRGASGAAESTLATESLQSSSRAFELTGAESALETYQASELAVARQKTHLGNLTADNPVQRRLLPSLRQLDAQNIQQADLSIEVRRLKSPDQKTNVTANSAGQPIDSEFLRVVRELQGEELRLLSLRETEARRAALAR